MSNQSRFDRLRLLSGNAETTFNNSCLRPELNTMQCEIRLAEDKRPLLDGTKVILALGDLALTTVCGPQDSTINELRGSLLRTRSGIPVIASFIPQDCIDIKNHEKDLNPLSHDFSPDDRESDDDDEGDVKRFAPTKRANMLFWLKRDVWKAKQLLANKIPPTANPKYIIYPSADEVIGLLTSTKGAHLYFDIETDYEEQNLQCFAFSFDSQNIYCVPVLDWNYKWAYASLPFILRALARAIISNTVVAHNGAAFDFFVLAYKYGIHINKTYDTMVAWQRCFPDVEKSLGHFVSYTTWERFHKDEDSLGYHTKDQMMRRLSYCGKDVYTMALGKKWIDDYARTIPGLEKSISDAMRCIRPYLISTLTGINVDEQKIKDRVAKNDALMFQYNRMIEILIGEQGLRACRGTLKNPKKASLIAGSNPQCAHYFHELMGYPAQGYGKPDKKTGVRSPNLGKKSLYRLYLKYQNPVISLICAYRKLKKETSRLLFTPYVRPSRYEQSCNIQTNINKDNVDSIPRPDKERSAIGS